MENKVAEQGGDWPFQKSGERKESLKHKRTSGRVEKEGEGSCPQRRERGSPSEEKQIQVALRDCLYTASSPSCRQVISSGCERHDREGFFFRPFCRIQGDMGKNPDPWDWIRRDVSFLMTFLVT